MHSNNHKKLPTILNPDTETKPNSLLVASEMPSNTSPKSPLKKKKRFVHILRDKIQLLSFRTRLQIFLSWRVFEFFIFILIVFYMFLVFATFAIDDPSLSQDIDQVDRISVVLKIIEIVILGIFCNEIVFKALAFGFKKYFSDIWLLFDAIVIIISLILVILDLTIYNQTFSSISKIFRVVFRFLRLFLLFRKVSQFKKLHKYYSHFDVKSPVEKCLEILMDARKEIDDNLMLKDIEWCMEMISSNKLFDPLIAFRRNEDDPMSAVKRKEVVTWIESYGKAQEVTKKNGSLFAPNNLNLASRRGSAVSKNTISKNPSSTKMGNLPNDIAEKLENVDDFSFDCFVFHQQASGNGISHLVPYLFNNYGLFEEGCKFEQGKLYNFAKKIQIGYKDNPYHNKIHGFDVCQTVNVFLNHCKFITLANLSHLDIASMILASSVHDYEHPGYNNMYLVNTRDIYALRYNDKSVLENHHIAASWLLTMSDEKCDIFTKLDKDEYKKIRERMISMVLATDMTFHFSDMAKMKARLASSEFDLKEKDRNCCMDILIHAADISNPVKNFHIYAEWTDRILKEYWNQGDHEREKNLPVSYLMDRYTVNKAKSQIGFINVIVQPLFEVIKSFLPEVHVCIKNLEENKALWTEKIPFYDEQLKTLNEEIENREDKIKQDLV